LREKEEGRAGERKTEKTKTERRRIFKYIL
jgi:hypothetical protein